MTYGIEFSSGFNSDPIKVAGKPALSLYASHQIWCSFNGKSYRWGSITVTGAVGKYIALTGLNTHHFAIAQPQAGGGYKITVDTPGLASDQYVTVHVLTDQDVHIPNNDYGLAIYSDTEILQFSSNGTYPRVTDQILLSPGGVQTININNPSNEPLYAIYGGPYQNGYFMSGSFQPFLVPTIKFNSNTQIECTLSEIGLANAFQANIYPNYVTFFVL